MVRINSLDTEYAERDLMEVMEAAADRVDVVMIPKVASAADVAFVDSVLTRIEDARGLTRRIGIEAQIESAAGFLYVREIASASSRLEGLIFGPVISRRRCRCPRPPSASSTPMTRRIRVIATTP